MKGGWFGIGLVLMFTSTSGAERGNFVGGLVVERVEDPFVAAIRVLQDFSYRDAGGKLWPVSRGQILDGKGLPTLFRDIGGPPYEGEVRKSVVVYESATQRRAEDWQRAQRMFFEASLSEGMAAAEAKVLYLLLAIQGTRWEVPGSGCFGVCHMTSVPLEWRPVINEARTTDLVHWVRASNPTIEEIDLGGQSAIRAPGPHVFTQPACNEFSGSTRIRKSCD
ncbi:MAG: DUF1353 domain-containing protein [Burkholderiales bacterium]